MILLHETYGTSLGWVSAKDAEKDVALNKHVVNNNNYQKHGKHQVAQRRKIYLEVCFILICNIFMTIFHTNRNGSIFTGFLDLITD